MKVLLDTCVLSDIHRSRPNPAVVAAVAALNSEDLFLSVLSIGEITRGMALLADGKRKRELRSWLQTIETTYRDRLLPIDVETCRIWGELTAAAIRKGRTLPASDALIAASARQHGLYVMTRNTADFEPTGVLLLNPWAESETLT